MIHFTCEHCRKSVRVDDRYGGKKGRCPHCKETVAIPGKDAIGELAAAFGATEADDSGALAIPPPPGVGDKAISGEFVPPGETDGDLSDTIILPAGVFAEKQEAPSDARSSHPVHRTPTERHRPALNAVRMILILVGVIVVLIVAVLGFALATSLL
jgi:hypothetical protein